MATDRLQSLERKIESLALLPANLHNKVEKTFSKPRFGAADALTADSFEPHTGRKLGRIGDFARQDAASVGHLATVVFKTVVDCALGKGQTKNTPLNEAFDVHGFYATTQVKQGLIEPLGSEIIAQAAKVTAGGAGMLGALIGTAGAPLAWLWSCKDANSAPEFKGSAGVTTDAANSLQKSIKVYVETIAGGLFRGGIGGARVLSGVAAGLVGSTGWLLGGLLGLVRGSLKVGYDATSALIRGGKKAVKVTAAKAEQTGKAAAEHAKGAAKATGEAVMTGGEKAAHGVARAGEAVKDAGNTAAAKAHDGKQVVAEEKVTDEVKGAAGATKDNVEASVTNIADRVDAKADEVAA